MRNNRTLFEERHIEMSETGLSAITEGGLMSFVPWPYVVRCTELKRFYVLHLNEGDGILIDRSAFPDTCSEEQFRTWLTEAKPR